MERLSSFDRTEKRIRRLVPSVLSQGFQGKGIIIFEGMVPSKTSVKAMITSGLQSRECVRNLDLWVQKLISQRSTACAIDAHTHSLSTNYSQDHSTGKYMKLYKRLISLNYQPIQVNYLSRISEHILNGNNWGCGGCQVQGTLSQKAPTGDAKAKLLTLVIQIFRQPKKYPLLIQRSRPSRDSQEPKTRKKFQFP